MYISNPWPTKPPPTIGKIRFTIQLFFFQVSIQHFWYFAKTTSLVFGFVLDHPTASEKRGAFVYSWNESEGRGCRAKEAPDLR
jgi:hypothetical protein